MFQFSQIVKNNGNEYDTNEYYHEDNPTRNEVYEAVVTDNVEDLAGKHYIVYLGKNDTETWNTVYQWSVFTKRNIYQVEDLGGFVITGNNRPDYLLIDAESVDVFKRIGQIDYFTERGVHTIFCTLPDAEKVKESKDMMRILGIDEVKLASTSTLGLRLFSGFFLEGEAIYTANNEEEEKLQDFNLEMPWYITGKGTKTFMVGLKNEKDFKREDFPRVLWRHKDNHAFVYAVNGDYMKDIEGFGILNGFVYDSSDYLVYPVVNAQNVTIFDFPSLGNENNDKLEEIYSRTTTATLEDIIWPQILSMATRSNMKLTCYVETQYDYTSKLSIKNDVLTFYLQQLKEADAEAGESLNYMGDITYLDKIDGDISLYKERGYNYKFGAMCVPAISDELKDTLEKHSKDYGLHSLTSMDIGDNLLVSYYTDDVTLLGPTAYADRYTYTDDFRLRSLISSIGYGNTVIDLHRVMWPENSNDYWQIYFEKVLSNIDTYYTRYDLFDYCTMSETDARVRRMLDLNYSTTRTGNVITIQLDGQKKDGDFVLRTHSEDIKEITGGTYKKLNEYVYLVHLTSDRAMLTMEQAEEILTYDGPF